MSYQLITRGALIAALHAEAGNLSAAASRLGVSREALRQRVHNDTTIAAALRTARKHPKTPTPCPTCKGTGIVTRPS